jgi:type I restriction enzyme S subunit
VSRIDDLIRQHCPQGVVYRALGDVGEVFRGRRFTKADYVEEGTGAIHYGELYTHYGTAATEVITRVRADLAPNLRFVKPGDVVIAEVGETLEDVGKAVAWLGTEEVAIHDGCYGFRSELNPVFVAYYLQTAAFHAEKNRHVARAKVKRLSINGLRQIRIPVPPTEIQDEIVRVLNLFQSLGAELEAELEARTRQYAIARSNLLSPAPDGAVTATLGEICTRVTSGGTPLATRREYYGGDIPWLRTQEVRYADIVDTEVKITQAALENSAARWVPANSVIVAISGAGVTRGRVAVNRIPLTTNQHCCALQLDPHRAHYRYVFHWLVMQYDDLRSRGQGNRSDLNMAIVKGYPIVLPPLAEQTRIASVLDHFDALVNDLSVGLPAELAARRKQYEYYRDRLLMFEEAA